VNIPILEILSKDEVKFIKEKALDLLEEVGVFLPIKSVLNLMEDCGCEVDYQKQVVKISPQIVEESIKKIPHTITLYSRDRKNKIVIGGDKVNFGTVGFATRMINGKENHSLTTEDLIQLTKLADAMENVETIMAMGQPTDVPQNISDRYQWLISLENSNKPILCQAFGKKGVRDAIKMGSIIAGGEEQLRKYPDMCLVMCTSSPLAFDKEYTEAMLEAAKFGLPVFVVSGPLACMNSPATLAGTLILTTAEELAAVVMTRLVNPSVPMIYATWARTPDLSTGGVNFGSPDYALMNAASAQVARHLGIPSASGGIISDSKVADAQAGYEKAFISSILSLSRINLICGMGILESENAGSLEQLIIDNEIVSVIKKFFKGMQINEETAATDLIAKVGILGSFLEEKHTLAFFRNEIFASQISDKLRLDAWVNKGSKDTLERAREIAKRKIKEHKGISLSEEVHLKLKNVIKTAEKESE